MMIWRTWRRLSRRAERAGREAQQSQDALTEAQGRVFRPLARQKNANEFARMISDGIRAGYGEGIR
jgi:hypothetical protein